LKEVVKELVKGGQLELVHGGLVGNDEACPLFNDILDNMMLGRRWVKEEFDIESKIAWHIDAFGHSSVNA
jgi:alpha-mannosidase